MIPRDYITEWRAHAPWVQDFQVEQDLVISRALIAIFNHPVLADALAFRGGTALYKLHIHPPARYSEDIDLVQVRAEPAGPMMDAIREVLDPWLGRPRWKQTEGRVTFVYRFPVRRYAAANAQAQGGNQFEGAFYGVRIHSTAIQRHLSLV